MVRFTYADGSVSAEYEVGRRFELPDGVIGVEVRQLPSYPGDYPAGDADGWMNLPDAPPGGTRLPGQPEVRGPARFRPPPGT